MCDFKPGDEIVCVDVSGLVEKDLRYVSLRGVYTAGRVKNGFVHPIGSGAPLSTEWFTYRFRKVERRNDILSIEAFLTIKPGFKEPRKAPAKRKERAQ